MREDNDRSFFFCRGNQLFLIFPGIQRAYNLVSPDKILPSHHLKHSGGIPFNLKIKDNLFRIAFFIHSQHGYHIHNPIILFRDDNLMQVFHLLLKLLPLIIRETPQIFKHGGDKQNQLSISSPITFFPINGVIHHRSTNQRALSRRITVSGGHFQPFLGQTAIIGAVGVTCSSCGGGGKSLRILANYEVSDRFLGQANGAEAY
mmetsp:Transcript_16723/g.18796  ORF Transcript_16723/g.18796 Transcript_16723/m.18796 type:complete len:203 (+) Transcript_16723:362-970(+)